MMTAADLLAATASRSNTSLVVELVGAGLPTDDAWTLVRAARLVVLSDELLTQGDTSVSFATHMGVEALALYRIVSGRLLGGSGAERSDARPTA